MGVPTVTLAAGGAVGILPAAAPVTLLRSIAELPRTVKLGRRSHGMTARAPHLEEFLDDYSGKPLPQRVDWFSKARASIGRMYCNDQLGCCVISGKAHTLGGWTAFDADSGGEVFATDDEIRYQYSRWCGPGDNGCFIPDVLERMRTDGFSASGKLHRIAGWVNVNWRDKRQLQTALYLFGPLTIGVNLPAEWTSNAVWDVTNTPIVGGHDVSIMGYDERGYQIASWGRLYLLTNAAAADRRYLEECYALLSADWYNSDRLTPMGVNVEALNDAINQLQRGQTPDIPGDGPPPPPPPPPPATWPVYQITGTFTSDRRGALHSFTGTATPNPTADHPDAVDLPEMPEQVAAAVAALLWPVMGVRTARTGRGLRVERAGLPKGKWSDFITALIPLIEMIIGALTAQTAETGSQDASGSTIGTPGGSGQGGKPEFPRAAAREQGQGSRGEAGAQQQPGQQQPGQQQPPGSYDNPPRRKPQQQQPGQPLPQQPTRQQPTRQQPTRQQPRPEYHDQVDPDQGGAEKPGHDQAGHDDEDEGGSDHQGGGGRVTV